MCMHFSFHFRSLRHANHILANCFTSPSWIQQPKRLMRWKQKKMRGNRNRKNTNTHTLLNCACLHPYLCLCTFNVLDDGLRWAHWPHPKSQCVLNKNVLRLLIIVMVGVFGAWMFSHCSLSITVVFVVILNKKKTGTAMSDPSRVCVWFGFNFWYDHRSYFASARLWNHL